MFDIERFVLLKVKGFLHHAVTVYVNAAYCNMAMPDEAANRENIRVFLKRFYELNPAHLNEFTW